MKLEYLYIEEYKILKDLEINFGQNKNLIREILEEKNINSCLLVGKNGSGKTTILSFIVRIFNFLEKDREKIGSDFEIKYSILLDKDYYITIKKYNGKTFFKINDSEYYLKNKGQKKYDENYISFSKIKKYLPKSIIASAFSIHGEYPMTRTNSFQGEKLVYNYDVSKIYGKNHWGISVSKGIYKFVHKYIDNRKNISEFLKKIGVSFSEEIKIRVAKTENGEYIPKEEYQNYNLEIEIVLDIFCKKRKNVEAKEYIIDIKDIKNLNKLNELVELEIIYINDLYFNSSQLNLDNMSSGEKILWIRLLTILNKIDNNSLVIIEEPELHLNPVWVKMFIDFISLFLEEYNCYILLSSHNPLIINNFNLDEVLIVEEGKVFKNKFPLFLGSEKYINNYLFELNGVDNIYEDKILKKFDELSFENQTKLIEQLGESFLRYYLFNRMKKGDNYVESIER